MAFARTDDQVAEMYKYKLYRPYDNECSEQGGPSEAEVQPNHSGSCEGSPGEKYILKHSDAVNTRTIATLTEQLEEEKNRRF